MATVRSVNPRDEVRTDPRREVLLGDGSVSGAEDYGYGFGLRSLELEAIDGKECVGGDEGSPLVSIHEGVVLCDTEGVRC